jgi:outer membrane protein assembly factor BamB
MPGQGSFGGAPSFPNIPLPQSERGTLTAYDPSTGMLAWQANLDGMVQAGVLVTAGNLVFASPATTGDFMGFNATTGERVFSFYTGNRVHAPAVTYQINGEQLITVAAGDVILTFALPKS